MTADTVSYDYTALESALEKAAVRLPMSIFCDLLERVEYVISVRGQADALENEILGLLGKDSPVQKPFHLERIAPASAQAA